MAKNLVSIAGYDPSAGAGVRLDIAVFEGLGHRGYGVLTAVTAQNAGRVDRVMPVTPRAVEGQFARLAEAVEISGIKAGMLATAANLSVVAGILAGRPGLPRVVDPVFRSTSGTLLLQRSAWPRYLPALRGKADLITPNLDETGILAQGRVTTVAGMKDAAGKIAGAGGMACLVKGGHLEKKAVDVLCDGRGSRSSTIRGSTSGASTERAVICPRPSSPSWPKVGPWRRPADLAIERIGAAIRDAVPAGGGRRVFDLSRERSRPRTGPRKRR